MPTPAPDTRYEQLRKEAVAFFREHPSVWHAFVQYADQARTAGKKIGAKAVWERIRWETHVVGSAKWDLNNNFTSFYAVKYNREVSADFFDMRKRTSKETKPKQEDAPAVPSTQREMWWHRD